MTIDLMHIEFGVLMDKVASGAAPSFLVTEVDLFLNSAIDRFVAKRAFGNNPRKESFEDSQKRRDDLRNLMATSIIDPSTVDLTTNKPNGLFFTLPADYRHSIQEEVIARMEDEDEDRRVPVKPITHARYNKIIADPFNRPNRNNVYRLDHGVDQVELICLSGDVMETYHLRYLKNPAVVNNVGTLVNCDLAAHTHREIIRMAVLDAFQNIEDPRYQTGKGELNDIE